MNKLYFTLPEVAKILGISRIAVYKKVKSGQIVAEKIGRNYAVSKGEYGNIIGDTLSVKQKKIIDDGVKKTVKEYGETLKKLGNE